MKKIRKRGISIQKIIVVFAQDRDGKMIARKAGQVVLKRKKFTKKMGEFLHPSSLSFTYTATNYKKFATLIGLLHETVNERQKLRVKKGIYHIQHFNNFHNRLKGWMDRFPRCRNSLFRQLFTLVSSAWNKEKFSI